MLAWPMWLVELVRSMIPCYYGAEFALAAQTAPHAPTSEQRDRYAWYVWNNNLERIEKMGSLFVAGGALNAWFSGECSDSGRPRKTRLANQ